MALSLRASSWKSPSPGGLWRSGSASHFGATPDSGLEAQGCNPSPAGGSAICYTVLVLPPTSQDLLLDETRPYFLWWLDATVGQLRAHLRSEDATERSYWLGSLLREANTRDVWLYTSPAEIRENWPRVWRHLGKSRGMWCHLLKLEAPEASDLAL